MNIAKLAAFSLMILAFFLPAIFDNAFRDVPIIFHWLALPVLGFLMWALLAGGAALDNESKTETQEREFPRR